MACTRTYVGLCIHSVNIAPSEVSERLQIAPTSHRARDLNSRYKPNREHHFWLWSTKDLLDSTDHLDHLREVFSVLAEKQPVLDQLRSEGCTTSVSCYWDSDGQGGPYLDLDSIRNLDRLGLDIWWDVYFGPKECRDDV